MMLTRTCPFCGKTSTIEVSDFRLKAWESGMLIQDAFGNMNASERELIKTGMCFECQDEIFEAEDDEPEWDEGDLEMGFDPYAGCYSFDC